MATVLAILCLLLCSHAFCDGYPEMPDTAQKSLSKLFTRYHTTGACVAVSQNGKIIGVYCFGSASANTPVTPECAFRVGSISKMVSCFGLLRLLDEKGIPLDTALSDLLEYPVYNPSYPDVPVTLRQLMTHTASLTDCAAYRQALHGSVLSLRTLLCDTSMHAFSRGAEPGTREAYSNFGGGLIGSLIEKISGQTLDDFMRSRVFEPLGVRAAYQPGLLTREGIVVCNIYDTDKHIIKQLSQTETEVRTKADPEHAYIYTAGKLMISAPDLCKLLIALCDRDERLMSEQLCREMCTAQSHRGSVYCDVDRGLFLNILKDHLIENRTLYGHGGKADGMICAAYFDPESRVCIAMLTNGTSVNSSLGGLNMLSRQVLRVCLKDVADLKLPVESPYLIE